MHLEQLLGLKLWEKKKNNNFELLTIRSVVVAQESDLFVFVERVPKAIKWGHRQQIRTNVPVANEYLAQAVKNVLCLCSHDHTRDQHIIWWSEKPSASSFAVYEIHKLMEYSIFITEKTAAG